MENYVDKDTEFVDGVTPENFTDLVRMFADRADGSPFSTIFRTPEDIMSGNQIMFPYADELTRVSKKLGLFCFQEKGWEVAHNTKNKALPSHILLSCSFSFYPNQ